MLSEKPWKSESVILIGAAMMLCVSVGMMLSLSLGQFLPDLTEAQRMFGAIVIGAVTMHGAAVLILHVALRQHRLPWVVFLGLDQPRLGRSLALGAGVGFLVIPLALGLNALCGGVLKWVGQDSTEQMMIKVMEQNTAIPERLIQGFIAIIAAPVAEEGIFRGIIYPAIKQAGHPRAALWGSSFLFAVIHMNLASFLPLLMLAVILVWLYERTDCLLAPMVAHAVFNLVNFLLLIFHVKFGESP